VSRTIIRLRKHNKGQIINNWLILIVILGAVIAAADGLTRGPNPELELVPPTVPLEYEPYQAAFLLGGVTLPLMLAYAKKARVSFEEALFLWFIFCTAAYMKDFSYLRWPGTPLFVTDIVLVVLLVSIYLSTRRSFLPHSSAVNISLTLFIAAGVLAATRGFLAHRDTILVLRDFALIEYSLFLLVGYHIFQSAQAIRRVAVWFALGTALSVLNGFAWFVVAPDQRRFIVPGIYVLISLVGVLLLMANHVMRPHVGCVLAGIFFLGLVLANARSLFVTIAILSVLALLLPGLLREKGRAAFLVTALAGAVAVASVLASEFSNVRAGRDFTMRVADDMSSGVLHAGQDQDWQFRIMAWKEAWRRFENDPLAGEGFGVRFTFGIWDNDPRPHNTFLTVLYKTGILGLLPLFAFLAFSFQLGLRSVHRGARNARVIFLQIAILVQVAFCLYGAANLLLESPFLASLFWAAMGLGLRMTRMLKFRPIIARIHPCLMT